MFMNIPKFYYASQNVTRHSSCFVKALGIHEKMEPKAIRHGGWKHEFLFMFFHNQAWLDVGSASQQDACRCMIVWSPEKWHDYGNPQEKWDHSWMEIHGDSIKEALSFHRFPLNRPLFFHAESIFTMYLELLHAELNGHNQQDAYTVERMAQLCIHELARSYHQNRQQIPPNIEETRTYMESHLHMPLSLPELAARACLSVPQFSSLFKRHYGAPPMRILARLRMDRAVQLLIYQRLSVKQTAASVGFQDQLHFSRQFKRYHGIPPSMFSKTQTNPL